MKNVVLCSVRLGTADAQKALKKLKSRLSAFEQLDHASFRERAKKVFGRALTPSEVVTEILATVRKNKDKALFDYAERIDGIKLNRGTLKVTPAERKAGYKKTPKNVRAALELSAARIADYQTRLLPADIPSEPAKNGPPGIRTGLRWSPLTRVGLYVPGGTAAYPSTVLMTAVPALVAGVRELAVCTPCGRNGEVNQTLLCACEILGLKEVYKLGGAQAIGAMAYGTETIRPVDKIAGPGNLFVMLAKRAVFGHVDIDGLFGPSEVLVIADSSANPRFIAADLLAQAEHDVLASCMLVTDSSKIADAVQAELARQLESLPRKEIAAAALKEWGLIVQVPNLQQAVTVANSLAPEHLELMVRNPAPLIPQLTSAGAIFVGGHATEPLGDYIAGPSHTLPTGGTARAFSGLSVYTFMRRTSIIEADADGLYALAPAISALADAEGLEAHKRAVLERLTV